MEHGASGCCRNSSSSGNAEGFPHTISSGSACASRECGRGGLGGDVHRGGGCPGGHASCNGKCDPPCRRRGREDICVEGAATCDGNGDRGTTEGLRLTRTADCAGCGGSGMVPTPSADGGAPPFCSRCKGAGFVEEMVDLVLSIPAGVEKGRTEIYRGEGHVDLGGKLHHPSVPSNRSMRDRHGNTVTVLERTWVREHCWSQEVIVGRLRWEVHFDIRYIQCFMVDLPNLNNVPAGFTFNSSDRGSPRVAILHCACLGFHRGDVGRPPRTPCIPVNFAHIACLMSGAPC